MTVDTRIQELIINKLTKEQYDAAMAAGQISDTEFYAVTDEDTYVDVNTFTNAMTNKQDVINASNKLAVEYVNGLANVATSGDYADLTNTPELAAVALSGEYSDLLNKPTVDQSFNNGSANAQSGIAVAGLIANYSRTDAYANVAFSGDFADLTNVPAAATVDQVYNGSSTNAQSGTAIAGLIANYSTTDSFADVAFSGEYSDLLNKPELANIALTGEWSDLVNTPDFANVATSGDYADLVNTPDFANVALSGDYADLTNTPTVDQTYNAASANAQSGTAVAGLIANYMTSDEVTNAISNAISTVYKYKGSVATYEDLPSSGQQVGDVWNVESDGHNYAWTGTEWDRLAGTVDLSDYVTINGAQTLTNKTISVADNTIIGLANVAYDGEYGSLLNTPDLANVALSGDYADLTNTPDFANVALSGEYSDLLNKPELANIALTGEWSDLVNTPDFANVATSGDYADLTNTPAFANVALSGEYSDLLNKPTVDQAYNASSANAQSGVAVANAIANLSGVVFRDWSAS